jgi:hypothetical protein
MRLYGIMMIYLEILKDKLGFLITIKLGGDSWFLITIKLGGDSFFFSFYLTLFNILTHLDVHI